MLRLFPTVLFLFLLSGCALLELRDGQDVEDAYQADSHDSFRSSSAARQPYSEPNLSEEDYRIQSAIDQQDLVLGMEMNDVRSAWGDPQEVETAGNARMGNERWIYIQGLSSQLSRQLASQRVVYFEDGKVAGWQNGSR